MSKILVRRGRRIHRVKLSWLGEAPVARLAYYLASTGPIRARRREVFVISKDAEPQDIINGAIEALFPKDAEE